MGILGLIGNLLGIGKNALENRSKLKQLKAEQQFKILQAQTKAQVDRIMSNTVLDRGAVGSELTEDTITNIIQYFDNLLKYFTHNDKNYYIISDGLLTERNFFSEEYEEEITLTEEEIEEEIIADLETEEERVVYKFNRYLYHGSEGQEVKNLQSLLKDLGYFIFHKITGYYGLITTKAVSEFQRDNDLPGVGVVGPLTRKLLEEVQK